MYVFQWHEYICYLVDLQVLELQYKSKFFAFTWPEKQLFNSSVTFLVTFNFVPKQQQFSDKKLLSWAEQILLILIYCLSRLGYDASQHFRQPWAELSSYGQYKKMCTPKL